MIKTCQFCGKQFKTYYANIVNCPDHRRMFVKYCKLCGKKFVANSQHTSYCPSHQDKFLKKVSPNLKRSRKISIFFEKKFLT